MAVLSRSCQVFTQLVAQIDSLFEEAGNAADHFERNILVVGSQVHYNTERPHQSRSMRGRTPAEVFVRCLPKPKLPNAKRTEKIA